MKVETPPVLMSIKRVRGVFGLVSKTPLKFVVLAGVLLNDILFILVTWIGVLRLKRIETIESM